MHIETRFFPTSGTADAIEEAAARWVVIVDRRATPREQHALEEWLEASPRHRAAFARISAAWRRTDKLRLLGS